MTKPPPRRSQRKTRGARVPRDQEILSSVPGQALGIQLCPWAPVHGQPHIVSPGEWVGGCSRPPKANVGELAGGLRSSVHLGTHLALGASEPRSPGCRSPDHMPSPSGAAFIFVFIVPEAGNRTLGAKRMVESTSVCPSPGASRRPRFKPAHLWRPRSEVALPRHPRSRVPADRPWEENGA